MRTLCHQKKHKDYKKILKWILAGKVRKANRKAEGLDTAARDELPVALLVFFNQHGGGDWWWRGMKVLKN